MAGAGAGVLWVLTTFPEAPGTAGRHGQSCSHILPRAPPCPEIRSRQISYT